MLMYLLAGASAGSAALSRGVQRGLPAPSGGVPLQVTGRQKMAALSEQIVRGGALGFALGVAAVVATTMGPRLPRLARHTAKGYSSAMNKATESTQKLRAHLQDIYGDDPADQS